MIAIESWLAAAVLAVEESAPTLGFEGLERAAHAAHPASDLSGAFVALTSDVTSIQIGLLATADGHASLARTLLALPRDETLGDADKIDAVRELANVIAGGVKRGMIEQDPGLRIGLPVFVHGGVESTGSLESLVQHWQFCGERIALVILQAARRGAAA
jgi:hypothetical protein